jgi:hypothetical protein
MEEYIAFDSHKRYTWVEHYQANTQKIRQYRLEHAPGAIRQALSGCVPGTGVAIEATANWYGITDEIEQAGCVPRLVHPRKAKLRMGQIRGNGPAGARQRRSRAVRRTRPDVNRYLKWAFAEAANSAAVHYRRCPERHVSQLYARLRARKGHAKAVGAVARRLAEAAFHVLSRQQAYRDPAATAGRTSEV